MLDLEINIHGIACFSMVKRGGKEIVTVDIYKEIYDALKERAKLERYEAKEYINKILLGEMERAKFLLKYMPSLSLAGKLDDMSMLFIKDKKIGDEVEVYVSDEGKLHCEYDESDECVHVQFALLLPQTKDLKGYKGSIY
ncbi:MAG: hypothetical protein KGL95_07820 [Patescibacteria group bacterium]|nr:hypothetical protein [Patescibacteria group bacterium]